MLAPRKQGTREVFFLKSYLAGPLLARRKHAPAGPSYGRLRKRSGGPFGAPPGKSFEPKNLKSDEYMFLIRIKRVYPSYYTLGS